MGLWIVIIKFWQPGPRLTRLSLSGWDLRVETRDRLPPLCRGRLLTFNLIFVPGTEPTSGAPEHRVLGDNWWIPVEIIFRRSPPLFSSLPRARYAVTELGVREQFVKPGQISIHNRDLTSIERRRKSGLTESEQILVLQTCVQQWCQAQVLNTETFSVFILVIQIQ